jgi:hypothetical protein
MGVALAAAIALGLAGARPARADEPGDGAIVLGGLGLAIPTFFIGTGIHEGTHALAGALLGAEVLEIHPYPGIDPSIDRFRFGWTRVRGLSDETDRRIFLLAPKAVDLVLLGGYATLIGLDGEPDGRWGQLVLVVLASGLWVDFSKDILAFNRHNDVVRVMDSYGLHRETQRLPVRLAYAGVALAAGVAIAVGYQRLFADEPATPMPMPMLPLWSGRF